jgi:hypothetical protein
MEAAPGPFLSCGSGERPMPPRPSAPTASTDPTTELLDAVCAFVLRYYAGRAPRTVRIILDDRGKIELPVGPWFNTLALRKQLGTGEAGGGPTP